MSAVPAPASTVILIRDGSRSPEVLLLERHARSEFLPDMYVFPGGRVEEADHELADRVTGMDRARAAEALPTADAELALAFFVAAIRETFEESGILLARRRDQPELIGAGHASALTPQRLHVQSGARSFRDLVLEHDLELAADRMAVHAHWITPESVPRRFDTLFFSALAPPGQLAAHDGVEATDHVWLRPEDALSQSQSGERQIIFPTACNLETLCGFATGEEAFAASRSRPVVAVLPRFVDEDGTRKLVIPREAGYPTSEELLGR